MLKVEMQIWWQICFNSELIENMVAKKQTKNMLILAAKKTKKKCGKCGNFKSYKNMVKTVGSIISHSNIKKFNLKQHLTCKNYGIYVTECKMQYVGQTKNKFSTQWNNHCSFWNKFNVKDNND